MLFLVYECCTFSFFLRNIGNKTYLRAVFGFWRTFHKLRAQESVNFGLLRCQMKSECDDVRHIFKDLAPHLATGQLSLQLCIRKVSA